MKSKLISFLKYALFSGVGVVMLWVVFRQINLDAFLGELKQTKMVWIWVALFFGLVSHLFRALRWNLLIENMGSRTKLSTTFYALMFGYFANYALPRAGEVARCGILTKREKTPFDALFGTVISERLFDLVVLIVLLLITVLTQLDLLGSFTDQYFIAPLSKVYTDHTLYIFIILALLMLSFGAAFYFLKKYKERFLSVPIVSRLVIFLDGLVAGVKTILRLKSKWLFLLYTVMIWFCYLLMTWLPFYAISGTSSLDLAAGLTVLTIGSIGMVAPVPGGIGTYHFIVQAILVQIYAVDQVASTLYPTLLHTAQTAMIVVVGSISYFALILGKRKPLNGDNPQSNSPKALADEK